MEVPAPQTQAVQARALPAIPFNQYLQPVGIHAPANFGLLSHQFRDDAKEMQRPEDCRNNGDAATQECGICFSTARRTQSIVCCPRGANRKSYADIQGQHATTYLCRMCHENYSIDPVGKGRCLICRQAGTLCSWYITSEYNGGYHGDDSDAEDYDEYGYDSEWSDDDEEEPPIQLEIGGYTVINNWVHEIPLETNVAQQLCAQEGLLFLNHEEAVQATYLLAPDFLRAAGEAPNNWAAFPALLPRFGLDRPTYPYNLARAIVREIVEYPRMPDEIQDRNIVALKNAFCRQMMRQISLPRGTPVGQPAVILNMLAQRQAQRRAQRPQQGTNQRRGADDMAMPRRPRASSD